MQFYHNIWVAKVLKISALTPTSAKPGVEEAVGLKLPGLLITGLKQFKTVSPSGSI
jgi:hypothetical protein